MASTVNILISVILGSPQMHIQKVNNPTSPPAFTIEANSVHTVLTVLGEHAIGVDDTASDIVFSCTGTASQSSFFSIVNVKLYEARHRGIVIIKSLETAEYMFEGALNGQKFYLKYWQSPFAYKWSEIEALQPSDGLGHVSAAARKGVREYLRWSHLVQVLMDVRVKLAYREIKQWAQCAGLWSSTFGLLDGEYLAETLASMRNIYDSRATANDLVLKFLETISELPSPDAPHSSAFEGNPHADESEIYTSLRPQIAAYVREETKCMQEVSINTVRSKQSAGSLTRFINTYDRFLTIVLQNAESLKSGKAVMNKLMDGFDRDSPGISYRLWPEQLFNDLEATDSSYPDIDQEAFYLLGMKCVERADVEEHQFDVTRKHREDTSAVRIYIMEESDWNIIRFRRDPRRWDLTPSKDVTEVVLDDEEGYNDNEPHRLKKYKPKNISPKDLACPFDTPSAPLRPAMDVLNRLRYDPQYNKSDYNIGYQDRFTNRVKEIPLANWKTDVTEKEFIPQHRIVYYKNRDGLTIWDREHRLDLVFGSGMSKRPK